MRLADGAAVATRRAAALATALVLAFGLTLLLRKRRESRELHPEPVTSVSSEATEPAPFTSLEQVRDYLRDNKDAQGCVYGSSGRIRAWFVARGARLRLAFSPCGEDFAPLHTQCLEQVLEPRARMGLIPEKVKFLLTIDDRRLSAELLPAETLSKLCPDRPAITIGGSPPGVP